MKYPPYKATNGDQDTENTTQLRSSHSYIASEAREPLSHLGHRSIHATKAIHDSAPAKFDTLQRAARIAIEKDVGENCCWTLARAIKAFESETGSHLRSHAELCNAFNVWWNQAKPLLPPETDFHECQDDFINCYRKVISPLGQNVIESAKGAKPSEADLLLYGPKKSKLVALCRELQRIAGEASFFLGVRHAAEAMGTKDLYTARNALSSLVNAGVLVMERKGQLAGRKATRYRFTQL